MVLTNDEVEPVHHQLRLQGQALWYTHHGYRGLFGGIWRTGRSFFAPGLGVCLGPEVFYPIGGTEREAQAAFGRPRAEVMIHEAQVARAALAWVEPIARELRGTACLNLAGSDDDRHVLNVFLPVSAVQERFTPREWFLFWRQQHEQFQIEHQQLHSREQMIGSCA